MATPSPPAISRTIRARCNTVQLGLQGCSLGGCLVLDG
jgi:hypothetical protein